jgi:hypothetical protein
MTQSIRDYMNDIGNVKDKWFMIINEYHMAYDKAYGNFQKTVAAQKEFDAMKCQLAAVGLTIVTGGILTATYGSAVASTAAKEIALDAICKYNLERAFKIAGIVESSPTTSFLLGSAFNTTISKGYAEIVKDTTKRVSTIKTSSFAPTPTSIKSSLQNYVLGLKTTAYDHAKSVRDSSKMKDTEKDDVAKKMRDSEFFRPPALSVNTTQLELDLELCFHLKYLLERDFYVVTEATMNQVTASAHEKSRRSIEKLPSSSDYPKPAQLGVTHDLGVHHKIYNSLLGDHLGKTKGNITGRTIADIKYQQVGMKIRDRANELSKKRFKQTLYPDQTLEYQDGGANQKTLLQAEKWLKVIGPESVQRIHNLPRLK